MIPAIAASPGPLPYLWVGALIFLLTCRSEVTAAENILRTGEGGPLQTATVPLIIPGPSLFPGLTFDFAFATDETPQAGTFHDSVTFTLQGTNDSSLAILLTLDAFGLQLAPPAPGGFAISPGSLQANPIPYFGSAADPAVRSAYSVRFALPPEFMDQPNNAFFDLFDNFNGVGSVGYLRNVAVTPVPEPSVAWLLAAGALCFGLIHRFRKIK